MNEGMDPNTVYDGIWRTDGRRLLIWTAAFGRKDCMKFLIETGADVNLGRQQQDGPAIQTTWSNDPEAMDLLLLAGADPNAQNSYGKSLCYYASSRGNVEALKVVLAAGADPSVSDGYNNCYSTVCQWYPCTTLELQE